MRRTHRRCRPAGRGLAALAAAGLAAASLAACGGSGSSSTGAGGGNTGPYMLKQNDKTGRVGGIDYQTGKSMTIVRNPNWNASTYSAGYRPPAYLDGVNVNIGGSAPVIGQQVLKGTGAVQIDTPSQATVKAAYLQYPSQITFSPGSGDHYVAIDNHSGIFTDENLRKAARRSSRRGAARSSPSR